MASIAGPSIDSAVRTSGSFIDVRYTAGASGYNRIYADIRTLTGSWQQATSTDVMNGRILITSIAGTALNASTSYQVKLRARHNTAGADVNPSSAVTVGPWTVTTPELLAVTRTSSTNVTVTYQNATTGDGSPTLYLQARTPAGVWTTQASRVATSPSGVWYNVSGLSASTSWEFRLFSIQYGVQSGFSSSKSLNAHQTPTPSINSAERNVADKAVLSLSGTSSTATLAIQQRAGNGAWVTISTTTGVMNSYTATGLDGATSYRFRAQLTEFGVQSPYSSEREVRAFFGLPAGVQNLSAGRRTDGNTVQLTWTTSATTEAPYQGQRVSRADGDLGQFQVIATLGSGDSSYIDTTARGEESYRYTVTPYNAAGESSSSPTASVAPSVLSPDAPTNVVAAYQATDKVRLTWTVRESPEKPVTSQSILRRNVGDSAWTTVGSTTGVATSFTDTPGPNRIVEYAIRPMNSAGVATATSPPSDPVATTPAAPTTVGASWQGPTSILVTWAGATAGDSTDVEFSTNNSTWYPGTTPSEPLPASSRSWTQTSVSTSVPHWYRVRNRNVGITGTPASAWTYSPQVDAQTTPLAPTILVPESADPAAPIVLRMVHNPVDGTAQTLGQFRYRKQGNPAWITVTTATAAEYTIPAGTFTAGDVLEVQGHTAGFTAVYGPWSASLLLTLAARPSVTILTPAEGVYTSQDLIVQWAASSQTEALVELLSGPQVVESRPVGAGVREVTFTAVQDRAAYTVRVTVRDLWQWSLPATVHIVVQLDRPAPASLTIIPSTTEGVVEMRVRPTEGLTLTRYNWSTGRRGWTIPGGAPAQEATVTIDGKQIPALIVPAGTTVTSAPLTPPARLDGHPTATHLSAFSPVIDGQVRIDHGSTTGNVAAVPTNGPVALTGPAFTAWPAGQQMSVHNPGTEPLYIYGIWAGSDVTTGGPEGYFDGDTRAPGHVYGWNTDGTSYEAIPAYDEADANLDVAPTVRIDIYRSVQGGDWELIGTTDGGTFTDHLPPLCVELAYIARAFAATGGWSDSDPQSAHVHSRDLYLNYGPDLHDRVVGGILDPTTIHGGTRDIVLHQYADQPRYTAHRSVTMQPRVIAVAVELITEYGASTIPQWMDALSWPDDVVYREPGGLTVHGAAQMGQATPMDMYESTIAFTVSET